MTNDTWKDIEEASTVQDGETLKAFVRQSVENYPGQITDAIIRLLPMLVGGERKENCVNGLKHMAAYKALSLDHIDKFGIKDASATDAERYTTVEKRQLEVLRSAIFFLTGEEFDPPKLSDPPKS